MGENLDDSAWKKRKFEECLTLIWVKYLNFATARLGPDGPDALQEASIRAYDAFDDFKGKCTFEAWFRRILSNVTIDWIRKKRVEKDCISLDQPYSPLGEGYLFKEIPASDSDPAQIVLRKVTLEESIQMVFTLPEKCCEVFVLFKLYGYSHKEIQHYLSMPLGTVKREIHRAKELLQQRYGEYYLS